MVQALKTILLLAICVSSALAQGPVFNKPPGTTQASSITGIVGPANGGTGVANNAAATFTRSGNHALTITTTGTTGVTLPTSGTVVVQGGDIGAATGTSLTTTGKITVHANGTAQLMDIGATGDTGSNGALRIFAGSTKMNYEIGNQTVTDGLSITASTLANGTTFSAPTINIGQTGTLFFPILTTAAGTPSSICQNAATKEVVVNAALTCTVSSARFKDDIRPFTGAGLRMVAAMKPDSFFYKDRLDRNRLGLMAEDLAKIDPRLAEWDQEGRPNSIDFPAIMAVMIKAIQEQQTQIDAMKKDLATIKRGTFTAASLH